MNCDYVTQQPLSIKEKYELLFDENNYKSKQQILNNIKYRSEQINIELNNPDSGRKCSTGISRLGAFIDAITIIVKLNTTNELNAKQLINKIELEIGGQRIDEIYGTNIDILQKLYDMHTYCVELDDNNKTILIELPFSMFANDNLLEIYKLPRHEVRINIVFNDFGQNILKDAYLKINYLIPNKISNTNKIVDWKTQDEYYMSDNENYPISYVPILQSQYEKYAVKCNDKYIKLPLNFKWHTKMVYFYVTDENMNIIDDDIIQTINLRLNGHDITEPYQLDEALYISKKILDIPHVYCIPICPISNLTKNNLLCSDKDTIDFTYSDICLCINMKNKFSDKIIFHVFSLNKNMIGLMSGLCYLFFCC